ncbi:hypothetical protein [Streptomyces sp. BI87]|uniref:hypothetical protein n=1 Tax=Streptomyces sp. BI87 TaxID=2987521 RepID=UPI002221E38E|nr:hypothetical protein [Streptomyces sp. BI87]UYX96148.1 hypothetical protein OIM89_21600 [Streptomyces sp. BI87]
MLWPQRPQFDVERVVQACMSWLTSEGMDDTVRRRLPELKAREMAYQAAGEAENLLALLLTWIQFQPGHLDADLLRRTYTTAFVQRAEGRKLYNAIKAGAIHGACALCGLQQVSQLDHHAPKAAFPLLALTPLNLVPVCGPCNQGKSNKLATLKTMEAFHPYFDDLGTDRWLYARIDEEERVAVFEVRPPTHWAEVKGQRLVHHFNSHDLGERYRLEAGGIIARRRRRDAEILAGRGPEELQIFIREDAKSRTAYDPNSHETALLHALAESRWYLNGGLESLYT